MIPLVSVVLPYHNRADVLAESIESVLGQTFSDFELILVNDESTDASQSVAASFDDPRIRRAATARREGAGGARNRGIEIARGRYLAFQDSDDLWASDKLKSQVDLLASSWAERSDIGVSGAMWRLRGSQIAMRLGHDQRVATRSDVLAGCIPTGIGTPTLVLDRTRVAPAARFDTTFPCFEERDFVVQSLVNHSRLVVIDNPLVEVRRGRSDHIATPQRAALGYERLLDKYASDIARTPGAAEWLHLRAMREWVQAHSVSRANWHRVRARPLAPTRVDAIFAMSVVAGRRGLALAEAGWRIPHPTCP